MSTQKKSYAYPLFVESCAKGLIDWSADDFKVALLTSSYDPTSYEGEYFADISADEIASGNGYTSGGAPLPSPAVTVEGANIMLTAGDVTWEALTATFRWAVAYRVGGENEDILVARIDLNHAPVAVDYTVQWSNLGLLLFQIVNPE